MQARLWFFAIMLAALLLAPVTAVAVEYGTVGESSIFSPERWGVSKDDNGCNQTTQLSQVGVKSGGTALLLPLLHQSGRYVLWEDDNPWYRAWKNALSMKNERRIVLPLGDIDDVRQVSARDALSGNYRVLKALSRKYGAQAILLAVAEDEGASLKVSFRQVGGAVFTAHEQNFDGKAEIAMPEAVADLLPVIQADLSAGRTETVTEMRMFAPVKSLADWQALQKKLEEVDLIRKVDVQEIGTSRVTIIVGYTGNLDGLTSVLRQHGVIPEREEEGWSIRLPGADGLAKPVGAPAAQPPMPELPAPAPINVPPTTAPATPKGN